jgi:hypothetical protein
MFKCYGSGFAAKLWRVIAMQQSIGELGFLI